MAWSNPEAGNTSLPLTRWFVSAATLALPQAAGPVAFSLLTLSLTGDASGGAALILIMTLAQVAGAIPITRLGAAVSAARFLRWLIVVRTVSLLVLAALAAAGASFAWLFPFAALAGSVNGAAYGFLRSILNRLTSASHLPRALGISATLNEMTFVLAPVAAAGIGTISPVLCIAAVALLGSLPALLVPSGGSVQIEHATGGDTAVLSAPILLWLACSAAGSSAIAAIEIGAVALSLSFGYAPASAILFTVPLCLASVAGGIWVSVRNRTPSRRAVVAFLCVMTLGAGLAALQVSLAVTIMGAVLIGAVLAPLATCYSLVLDELAPPARRPEVFALLRTSNAVGVILASAALTATSLSTALIVVTALVFGVTLLVTIVPGERP